MFAHTFSNDAPETGPAITTIKTGNRPVETVAAGQWTLMWHKFVRNKVAVVAGIIILILCFVALFAELLAPALPDASRPQFTNAPPQELRLFTTQPDGSVAFQLHVTGYTMTVDKASLRRSYAIDENAVVPVGLFVQGAAYKLWGLIPMTTHLIGPVKASDTMYLLGTDKLGRDLLTRLIYGTRISMWVLLHMVTVYR